MTDIKEKLKNIKIDNLYIISDFDHTLTAPTSLSSSDVISKNEVFPLEYRRKHDEIDNYYRKIEKDLTITKEVKKKAMQEWNDAVMNLLAEYKITESEINEAVNQKDSMILREGAKEFIEFTHENNIPLIIISAGVKLSITSFLQNHHLLYDNVFVISNEIEFENGIVKPGQKALLTSQNKNRVVYPKQINQAIEKRHQVLLFGDNLGDALMAPNDKQAIKFAFPYTKEMPAIMEFQKLFDVLEEDTSLFKEIVKVLKEKC